MNEEIKLLKIYENDIHHFFEKRVARLDKALYDFILTTTNKFKNIKWNERAYIFLNNIKEIPKCAHCINKVHFISVSKGYHQFCCKKCKDEHHRKNKNIGNKISSTKKIKNKVKFEDRYSLLTKKIYAKEGKFYIENYCQHGDINRWPEYFNELYYRYGSVLNAQTHLLCGKCLDEYINAHILTDEEIQIALKELSNIKNTNENNVKKSWPNLYATIKIFSKDVENIEWGVQIVIFRNQTKCLPKCLNCNNLVMKKNKKKINDFCCRKCQYEYLKKIDHYHNVRVEYWKEKKIEINKTTYNSLNNNITNVGDVVTIYDYCNHGDLKINSWVLKDMQVLYKDELNTNKYLLCEKCKEEYFNNYILDETNINFYQNLLKTLNINVTEKYIKNKYPILYINIMKFTNYYKNISWSERKILFSKNCKRRPICQFMNCQKEVEFGKTGHKHTVSCKDHFYTITASQGQKQVLQLISDLVGADNVSVCDRRYKKELDVYVEDLNIAFEYNGIHYHDENHRTKDYHTDKWNLCRANNIKLFTIWEDNWVWKQDLMSSLIKDSLGYQDNIIKVNDCMIKTVCSKSKSNFLQINHIEGNSESGINIGLYYKKKLVSLMCFKKQSDNYLLTTYCNKLNHKIENSENILFEYFIINYKPEKIIAIVNCDNIFDLSFYEKSEFKSNGMQPNFYYRLKNKRQKPEDARDIVTEETIKINGIGCMEYEWNKK